MTQEEFVTQLREMNEDIAHAWLGAERVTALKLATRVARLLCDTSVPSFYPTLFVLVTEVMDTMGRLVFDRIRNKAEREDDGAFVAVLPSAFTADDVRQDAKDTCVNWFYKIGAVRDLLPRCYMEMALLKCYHFLQRDPPRKQVARLAAMLRGLGDPLAAAYARCYLARRGQALLPGESGYLEEMLHEFLGDYVRLARDPTACVACVASGLPPGDYVALLEPSLEWMLSRLCSGADGALLARLLEAAGPQPPLAYLSCLLAALPAWFCAQHARRLVALLRAAGAGGDGADEAAGAYARVAAQQQAAALRLLGERVGETPPALPERLALLRDAWRALARLPRLSDYLGAADPWLEYALRHFGAAELDTLLGDVAAHVAAAAAAVQQAGGGGGGGGDEAETQALCGLLQRVLLHAESMGSVLQLQHFLPLLDGVPPGPSRSQLLQRALQALTQPGAPPLADPVAIHFAFEACRTLSEQLGSSSAGGAEGDRREAGRAAVGLLQRVRFGRDLEAHLEFLVASRAAFAALPLVQEQCVTTALTLSLQPLAQARSQGRHSARTGAFAKACLAYAQVSAPSLPPGPRRAHLFLHAARAALLHRLLPHADALLRCCVTDCADAAAGAPGFCWAPEPGSPDAEADMAALVRALAATLVYTPGHPERGATYLVRALARQLGAFPWSAGGDAHPRALAALLHCLGALAQPRLAVQLEGVEGNDVLYAGDEGYAEELRDSAAALAQELLQALAVQPPQGEARRCGWRLLEGANALLSVFRASGAELRDAADLLVSQAQQLLPHTDPFLRATMRHAKQRFKAAKAETRAEGGLN